MRTLTADERKVARHALGLDQSKRIYRNRYFASHMHETLEDLVAIGAAVRETNGPNEKWNYYITKAGADAVLEPDESHDGETLFDRIN